jgi:hypothetical protein
MLRDRLVCGISDPHIQQLLLAETTLTLKSATDIALANESAARNCRLLGVPAARDCKDNEAVLRLQQQQQQQQRRLGGDRLKRCSRCLSSRHPHAQCPFANKRCFRCGKLGHTAKACKTPQQQQEFQQTNQLGEEEFNDGEESYALYQLCAATKASGLRKVPPVTISLCIDGRPCRMEVDTGSSVSLLSERACREHFGQLPPLFSSNVRLNMYSGQPMEILGQLAVRVRVPEQSDPGTTLPLLVVAGSGPNLLGRDWLRQLLGEDWAQSLLGRDWRQRLQTQCKSVQLIQQSEDSEDSVQAEVLHQFPEVFKELGVFKGSPLSVCLRSGARPKYFKARSVPFALRPRVEKQLRKEISQGVLYAVKSSDWASPIVPVLKSDGDVRVCADFKQTLNVAVQPDGYPLPNIDELFAKLSGGLTFSKLDLSQAFSQLPLDEEAQRLCTINTSLGLLRYARLPFGISTAPSMFQRVMDELLTGVPHCAAFIDDVIVTGRDRDSHMQNLRRVLGAFKEAGLTCKLSKCNFMQKSVTYLGHRIDAEGLHPLEDKVRAILDAPEPKDRTQLRSFLGLINYYGKFLPKLSTILEPLHKLLIKNSRWCWNDQQQQAFAECKRLMAQPGVLVHYDADKELFLECDASEYGLGAVIFHRVDGVDRPVAFASRTLAPAERNYCQLEKEALALVYGVKKFRQYLFGRQFSLLTDHRPLLGLLGEGRPIPALASGRVQRWALLLSSHRYRLVHRSGVTLLKADALSRLPLPQRPDAVPVPAEVVLAMDSLDVGPVTSEDVRTWTRRDPHLSLAVRCCMTACWPEETPDWLLPFRRREKELSVHDGCLLWGSRVVIPSVGRQRMLDNLHLGHPGASRMKALARSNIWWPNMDREIEEKSASCIRCQQQQPEEPSVPLRPWPTPSRPWSRLHVDYAGPLRGKMLLVIVDAFSKWIDIHITASATSMTTIEKLRQSFGTHGLPESLVTDNGPCFASNEFADFCTRNGIRHLRTPPYHPQSNGLAERAVRSLKLSLQKQGDGDLEAQVQRFLLAYRVTPHSTTGVPPCQLLMQRTLRTLIDCSRPDVTKRTELSQEKQKRHHDRRSKPRGFDGGDAVFCRDFVRGNPQWTPAIITNKEGSRWYRCSLPDNRSVRRHADHLRVRRCSDPEDSEEDRELDSGGAARTSEDVTVEAAESPEEKAEPMAEKRAESAAKQATTEGQAVTEVTNEARPRRSSRVRKPPERFGHDNCLGR